MIRALYSAGSGMNAQQMSIDNIANNLANANTAGFKARRTQFQDLLYQSFLQPGAAAGSQTTVPSGLQLGLGTRPQANSVVFSQGNFTETDNPLDLVIQGKGFFQVRRPDGSVVIPELATFSSIATAMSSPAAAILSNHKLRFHNRLSPSLSRRTGPLATPNRDRLLPR